MDLVLFKTKTFRSEEKSYILMAAALLRLKSHSKGCLPFKMRGLGASTVGSALNKNMV